MIVFLFKLPIFFVPIIHYYGKLFSAGHCVRCNVCLLAFKEIKGYYRSINDGLECLTCICSYQYLYHGRRTKQSLSVLGGQFCMGSKSDPWVSFPWGSLFYLTPGRRWTRPVLPSLYKQMPFSDHHLGPPPGAEMLVAKS